LPRDYPVGWAVAWTVLLLGAVLTPASFLPDENLIAERSYFSHMDLVVHFVLFTGFTGSWLRAVHAPRRWILVPALGLALAVGTELAQGLPFIHRDPSVLDSLADGVGVAIAWIATAILAGRSARFAGGSDAPVLAEEIRGGDLAGRA
jgi:hypothetical protein